MPTSRRIRRRLLRQVVRENVELARGLPPHPLRRGARWRRMALRLGVAVASAAVFATLAVPLGMELSLPPAGEAVPAFNQGMVHPGVLLRTLAPLPASFPVAIHEPGNGLDLGALVLGVRRVVIDPGHGGRDRGASGPGGLEEKDLTLDLARRLAERLRGAGFQPLLTRDADRTLSLRERTARANDAGGDLFVSIHVNWLETRRPCGVETYYLGPSDDPEITRLVAMENGTSGYSLADTKRLLEGIYTDFRQAESQRLAAAVQAALLASLRQFNPALEDRGVRSAPYLVLVGAQMPAILAEVSCLSSPQEARLLHDDAYREEIAGALFRGVIGYTLQGTNGMARGGNGAPPQLSR